MLFIILAVLGFGTLLWRLFDEIDNDIFYDRDRCENIISHYTGSRNMQVLRALSAGDLKPSDVKCFCASGSCGVPASQEYILINNVKNRFSSEYSIKTYESGSNHGMLQKVELKIDDGNGVITEHWICA